jgi:hypothetical protein
MKARPRQIPKIPFTSDFYFHTYGCGNGNTRELLAHALGRGERIRTLGGIGCAARASNHLTQCLPESASLIRLGGYPRQKVGIGISRFESIERSSVRHPLTQEPCEATP